MGLVWEENRGISFLEIISSKAKNGAGVVIKAINRQIKIIFETADGSDFLSAETPKNKSRRLSLLLSGIVPDDFTQAQKRPCKADNTDPFGQ